MDGLDTKWVKCEGCGNQMRAWSHDEGVFRCKECLSERIANWPGAQMSDEYIREKLLAGARSFRRKDGEEQSMTLANHLVPVVRALIEEAKGV